MEKFGDRYQIKLIRLKNWDYSRQGYYYVTICAHGRKSLFGEIVNGEIILNNFGKIAWDEWRRTKKIRHNIDIDNFVIMPNHIHGIIIINNGDNDCHNIDDGNNYNANKGRDTLQCVSTTQNDNLIKNTQTEQFGRSTKNSIPTIVKLFKATTTKQINILRKTPSAPVWQRNYYEHIIRDEKELNRIREYVETNVKQWEEDSENIEVNTR